MSEIMIKNISSATVVLAFPEMRFNRSLVPGRAVPISKEIYDEILFDPGMQNMIRGGYIKIEGLDDGEKVIEDANVLEKSAIEDMIAKRDITAFAKFIPTATLAEKETIVQYVVNNNITDNAFAALIKKYCQVDVVSAIAMQHQADEK